MKIIILIEGRTLSIPKKQQEKYVQISKLLNKLGIEKQVILTKQLRITKNFINSLDVK